MRIGVVNSDGIVFGNGQYSVIDKDGIYDPNHLYRQNTASLIAKTGFFALRGMVFLTG